jgi:hypothetical protein
MKWYSNKKYIPVQCGKYVVYSKITGYCYIAYAEFMNDGSFVFYNDDDDKSIDDATHFMFIPPIEIEE